MIIDAEKQIKFWQKVWVGNLELERLISDDLKKRIDLGRFIEIGQIITWAMKKDSQPAI